MTTTPEQIEAVALAMSRVDWCGARFNGESCLCDDPRLDDDVRSPECFCRLQAPAAIDAIRPFIRAESLEEAAKVADGYHRTKEVTRDLMDDGHITTTTVRSLADPLKIAAAIRALKDI